MARYTPEQEEADIARVIELTDEMRQQEDEKRKTGRTRAAVIERILTRGTTSVRELARRCGVSHNAIKSTRKSHGG